MRHGLAGLRALSPLQPRGKPGHASVPPGCLPTSAIRSPWGSATQLWAHKPTSTQFTFEVDHDPGQDVDFAWTVSVQSA